MDISPHPPYHTTYDRWFRETPRKTSEERLLSPSGLAGENVIVLDAAARLRHHLRHGVAPLGVMGRLLVLSRIGGGPENLDQHTLSGVSQPF